LKQSACDNVTSRASFFQVVTSFAELGLGIVYFVQSIRYPNYQQATVQMPVAIAILSFQVACDLTITITMVYYLRTRCSRVKRTITAMTTLALYSVMSGVFALIFSISCLITFVRFPRTLIYAPFFLTLVRVYVCAFMAILNSRDRIRTKLALDAKNGIMISLSKFSSGPNLGEDNTSVMGWNTADSTSQRNSTEDGAPPNSE